MFTKLPALLNVILRIILFFLKKWMGNYHEHELLTYLAFPERPPRSIFKREKLVLAFGYFPKLTIILSNKIYTGLSLTRCIELRCLGLQDTQEWIITHAELIYLLRVLGGRFIPFFLVVWQIGSEEADLFADNGKQCKAIFWIFISLSTNYYNTFPFKPPCFLLGSKNLFSPPFSYEISLAETQNLLSPAKPKQLGERIFFLPFHEEGSGDSSDLGILSQKGSEGTWMRGLVVLLIGDIATSVLDWVAFIHSIPT